MTKQYTVFFSFNDYQRTLIRGNLTDIVNWAKGPIGEMLIDWAVDTSYNWLFFKNEKDAAVFKLRWAHLFKTS